MAQTTQRQTAMALIEAFNKMEIATILSLRSPDCQRHLLPQSMGLLEPQPNSRFEHNLTEMSKLFHNFSLTLNDIVEDTTARKICMHLHARADTAAGEYLNEYIWILTFNEAGTSITNMKEFVDSTMYRDFYPKLQAALKSANANASANAPRTTTA